MERASERVLSSLFLVCFSFGLYVCAAVHCVETRLVWSGLSTAMMDGFDECHVDDFYLVQEEVDDEGGDRGWVCLCWVRLFCR